jgi:hypothetical protein
MAYWAIGHGKPWENRPYDIIAWRPGIPWRIGRLATASRGRIARTTSLHGAIPQRHSMAYWAIGHGKPWENRPYDIIAWRHGQ